MLRRGRWQAVVVVLGAVAVLAGCVHPRPDLPTRDDGAAPAPACTCPGPPEGERAEAPASADVSARMQAIAPDVDACFLGAASDTVSVSYTVDGASGRVTDLQIPAGQGNRAQRACARGAFDRLCFVPFRRPQYQDTFSFPLNVRNPWTRAALQSKIGKSACWTPALHLSQETAAERAERARRYYETTYRPQCKAETAFPNDAPHFDGSVPDATRKDVLAQHMAEVDRCYADALVGWPTLEGHLELALHLVASGSVQDAWIAQSDAELDLVACCVRVAALSWTFPAPTGGDALVRYPFGFKP